MRRVAIVQVRMTSTRLPGKVLMELAGRPMLAQVVARLRACADLDDIVIATTANADDDPVVSLAQREGVRWFRGSESDVLDRYRLAAAEADADLVVRITGDCPLLDPEVIDQVIERATDQTDRCDYASNTLQRTYPRGLDTEAFFRDVLDRCARLAQSAPAREHVTYFLHRERPDLFSTVDVVDTEDNSDLRWTVDTADDLAAIRAIYEAADLGSRILPYRQLLRLIQGRPELSRLNAHIVQKHT